MHNKLVLEGHDLTRTFGWGETLTTALNDVSVGFHLREMSLIMGPSGSGKSTLLAVLSGLLRPSSGQVVVLGHDLWALSDQARKQFRQRHYGFIFQGYNLFPALTARQQLEIIQRWGQGMPRREARRRVDEMLDMLGLGRQKNQRPEQLSGGEKQRVAIGRALIKEPALCFADEPTSALDWERGQQVVDLLRDAAHQRGTTVLVVSHDPRLVSYADRLFYLEDGSLARSPVSTEARTFPEVSDAEGI